MVTQSSGLHISECYKVVPIGCYTVWSISVLECSVTRVGLVTSCLNCKTRWRFVNFLTSPFFLVGNKSRFIYPSMISSLPVSLANTNVRSRASREESVFGGVR